MRKKRNLCGHDFPEDSSVASSLFLRNSCNAVKVNHLFCTISKCLFDGFTGFRFEFRHSLYIQERVNTGYYLRRRNTWDKLFGVLWTLTCEGQGVANYIFYWRLWPWRAVCRMAQNCGESDQRLPVGQEEHTKQWMRRLHPWSISCPFKQRWTKRSRMWSMLEPVWTSLDSRLEPARRR